MTLTLVEVSERLSYLGQSVEDRLVISLPLRTFGLVCPCLPAPEHDARHPSGQEPDVGSAEYHLDPTDHSPGAGRRDDIAVRDGQ